MKTLKKQLQDQSRLVYLVEHRAPFSEFRDYVLKEKLASYKEGVEKTAGLAGFIVDNFIAKK